MSEANRATPSTLRQPTPETLRTYAKEDPLVVAIDSLGGEDTYEKLHESLDQALIKAYTNGYSWAWKAPVLAPLPELLNNPRSILQRFWDQTPEIAQPVIDEVISRMLSFAGVFAIIHSAALDFELSFTNAANADPTQQKRYDLYRNLLTTRSAEDKVWSYIFALLQVPPA